MGDFVLGFSKPHLAWCSSAFSMQSTSKIHVGPFPDNAICSAVTEDAVTQGRPAGQGGTGLSVHQEMAVHILSLGRFPLYFSFTVSLKENGSFQDNRAVTLSFLVGFFSSVWFLVFFIPRIYILPTPPSVIQSPPPPHLPVTFPVPVAQPYRQGQSSVTDDGH